MNDRVTDSGLQPNSYKIRKEVGLGAMLARQTNPLDLSYFSTSSLELMESVCLGETLLKFGG